MDVIPLKYEFETLRCGGNRKSNFLKKRIIEGRKTEARKTVMGRYLGKLERVSGRVGHIRKDIMEECSELNKDTHKKGESCKGSEDSRVLGLQENWCVGSQAQLPNSLSLQLFVSDPIIFLISKSKTYESKYNI